MKAATCFSGIGAPEMGAPQYDWLWHAEIEPFPSAVMVTRHPESVNLGNVLADDFIERAKAMGSLDLLAGGPPCQAFSVAGNRGGMTDSRGNLTLRWVQIQHAIQPRNAITENVPGWLSMPDNAFGCFLGALVGADDALCSPLDGKWPGVGMASGPRARVAWRILDAQYFGVAQQRRRVFVVADFGNGADPAEILFERQGVLGNPAPRRETGQRPAPTLAARTKGGGGLGTDFDCDGGLVCLAHGQGGAEVGQDRSPRLNCNHEQPIIAHSLRAEGFDGSEDGTGRGTPLVPVAYRTSGNCGAWETGDKTEALRQSTDPNAHVVAHAIQAGALRENPSSGPDGIGVQSDLAYTIEARAEVQAVAFNITPSNSNKDYNARQSERAQAITAGGGVPSARGGDVVVFAQNQRDELRTMDIAGALAAEPGMKQQTYVNDAWAVRRLTPVECARLQGFPDDYCNITYRGKPAADGNIYKALGNSWAVPVGAWIINRISNSTRSNEHDV